MDFVVETPFYLPSSFLTCDKIKMLSMWKIPGPNHGMECTLNLKHPLLVNTLRTVLWLIEIPPRECSHLTNGFHHLVRQDNKIITEGVHHNHSIFNETNHQSTFVVTLYKVSLKMYTIFGYS